MKRLSSNLLVIDMCLGVDGFVTDSQIMERLDCCKKTAHRVIKSIKDEATFLDNIEVDVIVDPYNEENDHRRRIHKIRVTA